MTTTNEAEIMLALGRRPDLRIFGNETGQGWVGKPVGPVNGRGIMLQNARRIRFGLCPGSSDLIGIQSVVITPAMVGRTVGVFLAAECKAGTGRASADQRAFLDMVRDRGGIAVVARSADDVLAAIDAYRG